MPDNEGNVDKISKGMYAKSMAELAKKVYSHAEYQMEKKECITISESFAHEVIDLSEWMCNNAEDARVVANIIVKNCTLPFGASAYIKKYFNLSY